MDIANIPLYYGQNHSLPRLLTNLKTQITNIITQVIYQQAHTHHTHTHTHTHHTNYVQYLPPHTLYLTSHPTYIAFYVLDNALEAVSLLRGDRPARGHYAPQLPGPNLGQRLEVAITHLPDDGQEGVASVRPLHCGQLVCHGPGEEGERCSEVTSKEGFFLFI